MPSCPLGNLPPSSIPHLHLQTLPVGYNLSTLEKVPSCMHHPNTHTIYLQPSPSKLLPAPVPRLFPTMPCHHFQGNLRASSVQWSPSVLTPTLCFPWVQEFPPSSAGPPHFPRSGLFVFLNVVLPSLGSGISSPSRICTLSPMISTMCMAAYGLLPAQTSRAQCLQSDAPQKPQTHLASCSLCKLHTSA